MPLRRFLPDRFTCALVLTVLIASVLPCRGNTAIVFKWLTDAAIALLFFLHGAKLSREAAVAGLTHWRLHLTVLASTFVLFPIFGLLLKPLLLPLVTPALYVGVLFLCTLPSTVQSSIAFTSIARGNVSAAICSASASSLLGIVITPLVVGLIIATNGKSGFSMDAIGTIVLQLLVPFVAGQVAQRWIGRWVQAHRGMLGFVDQGSILLVVYTAFSAAVIEGLWQHTPLRVLGGLLIVNAVLLAVMLLVTRYGARALGFDTDDEITIVFCGSKKPRQRRTHGAGTVCRPCHGRGGIASDAVSPAPVDDLRGAGEALCVARDAERFKRYSWSGSAKASTQASAQNAG